MSEAVDVKNDSRSLGVDAQRLGQTEGPKSGRRKLVQEKNPLTEVRSGIIKGAKYQEQDFRDNASSSLWKEYILDKKQASGVLLDNNALVWFSQQILSGQEIGELARERYPDSKVDARFSFGEKALGMSSSDLAIKSERESFDPHLNSLVDYFGRSLNWQEAVTVSISYQDKQKEVFQGSMQEYLVSH